MVVAVGEIVRNGVVFDMKNWEGGDVNADNLPQIVEQLFSLFEQRKIDYLLVDGVALLSYIDGRNTQDVDFILSPQSLKQLPELIITEENRDFARAAFSQLQVDVLLTQNPLFEWVLRAYTTEQRFGDRLIRCATVEGLILLKLYALPSLYRQGQFDKVNIYESDITLLLLRYSVDMAALLALLKAYVIETDWLEIRQIAQDIQAQIARLRQRQEMFGQNDTSDKE